VNALTFSVALLLFVIALAVRGNLFDATARLHELEKGRS
jgi:hypothetical protein